MSIILILEKEHQTIRDKLIRLEEIIEAKNFNSQFLLNAFNEILDLMSSHEVEEDQFFKKLGEIEGSVGLYIRSDLKKVNMEHQYLKGYIKLIRNGLKTKNKNYVQNVIDNDVRMFLSEIKSHFNSEERIFDKLLFFRNLEQNPIKEKFQSH